MTRRIAHAFRVVRLALALAVAAMAGGTANAEDEIDDPAVLALLNGLPAPQAVTLPWRPGRFTRFQIGTEEEGHVKAARGSLAGELYRAPGQGAAPYAVLLSGCGSTYVGANGLWLKLWARALQDIGMGALALDSFGARGVENGVCGDGAKVWAQRRVDDAYSALAWLAAQPFADGRKIIVMGMSNGARATLLSVSAREHWRFQRFAAAVALYPACDRLPRHELLVPALMLLGEADEGAAPKVCEAFAEARRTTSFPPYVKAYPYAGHLFDVYPRGENYDAPEVVESRADALAFLSRTLGLNRTMGVAQPAARQVAAPVR